MFRKKDKTWKKLCEQLVETNHQLLETNRILVRNNEKLLECLKEKNYKINQAKNYSKMVINLWKDSKSDIAQCMVDNFYNNINLLDGEDK